MRNLLFFLFTLINFQLLSQIKIDQVGDNWQPKVEQAIRLIKKTDKQKYDYLIKHCKHITFFDGRFSTIEGTHTIVLGNFDMKSNSIENIASALVHETMHLIMVQNKIVLNEKEEECICYSYELSFLLNLPDCPEFLIKNCRRMLKSYECNPL